MLNGKTGREGASPSSTMAMAGRSASYYRRPRRSGWTLCGRSLKLRCSGPAMQNQDFRDLFAAFNAHGVEYLVVGAHALAVHGHIRATKDLDVWIRPSVTNAGYLLKALAFFGAPIEKISPSDFAQPGTTLQIGVDPLRIDILSAVDGIGFDEAWRRRIAARFADQTVNVISREDLIRNKRASGRTQDLADVEALEKESGE